MLLSAPSHGGGSSSHTYVYEPDKSFRGMTVSTEFYEKKRKSIHFSAILLCKKENQSFMVPRRNPQIVASSPSPSPSPD